MGKNYLVFIKIVHSFSPTDVQIFVSFDLSRKAIKGVYMMCYN